MRMPAGRKSSRRRAATARCRCPCGTGGDWGEEPGGLSLERTHLGRQMKERLIEIGPLIAHIDDQMLQVRVAELCCLLNAVPLATLLIMRTLRRLLCYHANPALPAELLIVLRFCY